MRLTRHCGAIVVAGILAAAPLDAQTLDLQAFNAATQPARSTTIDLDRVIANALDMRYATDAPLAQRTRTRPAQSQASGENQALKWVGVGLMVVGGLSILDSVAWCSVPGGGSFCTRPLIVGGAVTAGGYILFDRNR